MSDTPQGPGWWQASDDKWYPPPRPEMPTQQQAAPPTAPTAPVTTPQPQQPPFGAAPGPAVPPQVPPTGPPSGGFPAAPPTGPPSGGYPGAPGGPAGPVPGAPSPYGMPPGAPPPGGPTNRTPLFVMLGVLVTAALVGLYFVVAGGDDDEKAGDPPTTSTQPPDTEPEDPTDTTEEPEEPEEPTTDGPVQVVESGFSNYEDDMGDLTASYGFIVENQGEDVLQSLSLEVIFYAEGDKVITSKDMLIGTIRPGEKLGLADELFGEDLLGGVARFEVQVADVEMSIVDPAEVPDGEFEIGEPETVADDYNVTTTFHASWTYAEDDLYPTATAIYRNAAGDIIGGANGLGGEGSESDFEILTWAVIPDIDSTEIYMDPGYITN